MSEETATAETSQEGAQNPAIEGSEQRMFTQEEVNKLVGKARREAVERNEKYKAAWEELEQLKESQKSDLEKLQERATRAESELEKLTHEKELSELAAQVAKEKGIAASLLRGESREELEAHADEILAAFEAKQSTPTLFSDGHKPAKNATSTTHDSFNDFMVALGH